jgi:hypothetical protein
VSQGRICGGEELARRISIIHGESWYFLTTFALVRGLNTVFGCATEAFLYG